MQIIQFLIVQFERLNCTIQSSFVRITKSSLIHCRVGLVLLWEKNRNKYFKLSAQERTFCTSHHVCFLLYHLFVREGLNSLHRHLQTQC